jgi:signal peptidase I
MQAAEAASGPAPVPENRVPAGGLRLCFRRPPMLARWLTSRRFRRAVEARKHVWKILSFQRDELSPQAVASVEQGIRDFDAALRSWPSAAQLDEALKHLEVVAQKWLRPYANASARENVEVFLVAIGVAMAIRTFFLQPFKIPTGSMQPTLYGVHFEDLREKADAKVPGALGQVFSALFRGVFYHEIVAEADGSVLKVEPRRAIALVSYQDVVLRYQEGGRTWDERERAPRRDRLG